MKLMNLAMLMMLVSAHLIIHSQNGSLLSNSQLITSVCYWLQQEFKIKLRLVIKPNDYLVNE